MVCQTHTCLYQCTVYHGTMVLWCTMVYHGTMVCQTHTCLYQCNVQCTMVLWCVRHTPGCTNVQCTNAQCTMVPWCVRHTHACTIGTVYQCTVYHGTMVCQTHTCLYHHVFGWAFSFADLLCWSTQLSLHHKLKYVSFDPWDLSDEGGFPNTSFCGAHVRTVPLTTLTTVDNTPLTHLHICCCPFLAQNADVFNDVYYQY